MSKCSEVYSGIYSLYFIIASNFVISQKSTVTELGFSIDSNKSGCIPGNISTSKYIPPISFNADILNMSEAAAKFHLSTNSCSYKLNDSPFLNSSKFLTSFPLFCVILFKDSSI